MQSRFHKRKNNFRTKIEPIFLLKLFVIIALYLIVFALLNSVITRFKVVNNFEKDITDFASKNQNVDFEVEEILLYSTASATRNTQLQQTWGLDISQFTDISFYISNPQNKLIKSLIIKDIEFSKPAQLRFLYFSL